MENNTTEIKIKKESNVLYSLRIGGILLAVCTVVALVLSVVNLVTRGRIVENETAKRRDTMISLFDSDTIGFTELDRLETDGDTVDAVYRINEGEKTVGYCVSVLTPGFGGDIEMMVAMSPDKTIIGVEIVSLSETPGLGTRVNDKNYLAQYKGKGEALAETDVELISGATKSSRAVLAGVNTATDALAGHLGGVAK